jgi:hypothetical protein
MCGKKHIGVTTNRWAMILGRLPLKAFAVYYAGSVQHQKSRVVGRRPRVVRVFSFVVPT